MTLWNGGGESAIVVADEFGIDPIFLIGQVGKESPQVRIIRFGQTTVQMVELTSEAMYSLTQDRNPLTPVYHWTIPFSDAILVLFENREQKTYELI